MFWKFDLSSSSQMDSVLSRDGVVLSEVLDEEDVLQECKVNNRRLVEFLTLPENMVALVSYVTQEPGEEIDERRRYKYPSVSCEILTADVPQINDALGDDEALLDRLYCFLQPSGGATPLNPLLASFFSRVMGLLISRKSEQIISFLRRRDGFLSLLLSHIGTSAIMDLLLRLLTCVEQSALRQEVLNWLIEERIVQRLVDMIHPSKDEEQHCNGSSSLFDIIRLNRDQLIHIQLSPEHDQLLSILERQDTIEQLLSNMFDGNRRESVLVNGIQVLLTLLEPRRPRPELGGIGAFFDIDGQLELCHPGYDPATPQSSLGVLLAIQLRVRDFQQLLRDPPRKEPIKTTCGVLDPPLGSVRLQVVKLLNCILQANQLSVCEELLKFRVIETTLDLFFQYTFNNFLHTQVEQCVGLVFSNPWPRQEDQTGEETPSSTQDNQLVRHLLEKCGLIQRVLTAWEENEKQQKEGGRRRGYMGHLTRIANHIAQSCEKGPNQSVTSEIIKAFTEEERERWENFVSGALSEANQRNTVDLESTHNMHCSTDDEEGELRDFSFPQEAVLQQAFADYQIQQMTSNFIDHFGFNDEQFGEQEDGVNIHLRQIQSAPFDKASNINFSLNVDNESLNSSLFDLCCKEKIQQFDDEEEEGENSDEEDVWQGEEPRLSVGALTGRCRSSGSTDSRRSRDSEEEERENEEGAQQTSVTPDPKTKENFGWVADFSSLSISPAQSPVDPGSSMWERSGQPKGSDGESWVNFSNRCPTIPRSSQEVSMETSPSPQTAVTSQQSSKQTTDVLVAAPPSSLSPPASVEAKRTPSQTESNPPTAPPAVEEGKCTADIESNSSSAPPAVKEGKCTSDIESNSSSAPPAVEEGKCTTDIESNSSSAPPAVKEGKCTSDIESNSSSAPPAVKEGKCTVDKESNSSSAPPAVKEGKCNADVESNSSSAPPAVREGKCTADIESNSSSAPPAVREGKCTTDIESNSSSAPPAVKEGKCTADIESNSSSAPPAVEEGKCTSDIEFNSSSAPSVAKEGKCSPAKPESNTEKVVKLNPGNVEACTAPPTAKEVKRSPEINRETQSGSPAGEEGDRDSDKAGRSGGSSGASRSPKKTKNPPTAPPASTEGKCSSSSGPGRATPGGEREREEGAALPNGEREGGSSPSLPSMQRCSSDTGSSAATSDPPSVTQTVQDRPPADITEKATPTEEKPPSHRKKGTKNTGRKTKKKRK
ncbi:serine/threonine-protein phosphatase 6 regulatory subunit 1-like isoform X2 [Acipenser ruthenus]|uniref:serine/threonine-protein phosphatase 6 regulatory subunit 1-like isoform X2 n=1 Tax=Acipenser ruthenus TaxID=7906 RepID=UPI002741EC66|nr:serine/threonine-protein phosphatase 6 regulatory subunit 1-like isoform X2 [Acipenser ruthenus]